MDTVGPSQFSEVQTSFSGLAQRRFGPPSHAVSNVCGEGLLIPVSRTS